MVLDLDAELALRQVAHVAHGRLHDAHPEIPTLKLTDLMLSQALEGSYLQKAIVRKKLLLGTFVHATGTDRSIRRGSLWADIYTLGTILDALLTGQPPFDGDSTREVFAHVREGNVVRPAASAGDSRRL